MVEECKLTKEDAKKLKEIIDSVTEKEEETSEEKPKEEEKPAEESKED